MGVLEFLLSWVNRSRKRTNGSRSRQTRAGLSVEELESRTVLYSVTGDLWPSPQLVTISFVPDGTNLGGVTSNLFSVFNNKPSLAGRWQNEILRAAQVWAQQTNINFAVVPDDGAPTGSGLDQQGDPEFGDIRIGGFNFGSSTLARAYYPPPVNNYSLAGDINFNTAANFNVGTTYDLFTVAMHEFGHALGMSGSTVSSAAMWETYNGVKRGLATDDINGIRSIYSNNLPRSQDGYEGLLGNKTFLTATDLTPLIDPVALTDLATNLDMTTSTDVDYFSFVAPVGTSLAGGTLTVTAQSQGLSQLSPTVTVYSGGLLPTVLGSASGAGQYGSTQSVTLTGVSDLEAFYVEVQEAETKTGSWQAFNTGAYALTLNFSGGPGPTVPLPNTTLANGNPLQGGGGDPDSSDSGDDFLNSLPQITAVSTNNGANSVNHYTNAVQPTLYGSALTGAVIQISQDGVVLGTTVASSNGWSFGLPNPLANGTFTFTAATIDGQGNPIAFSDPYTVTVVTVAPLAPAFQKISPITGVVGSGVTNCPTPTISGSAQSNSTVTIYRNGQLDGTTAANSSGAWNYTETTSLANGTYTYTATATDLASNVSSLSNPFNVVVDTNLNIPTIAGVSQIQLGFLQLLTIQGTANPQNTIRVFLNGNLLGTTGTGTQGSWTYIYLTLTTPSSLDEFTAVATDVAGNVSASSTTFNLLLGSSAPTVSSLVLAGGSSSSNSLLAALLNYNTTMSNTPTLTGTATAGSVVTILDGDVVLGTATANAAGVWSYTCPNLADGIQVIRADATNTSGDTGVLSAMLILNVT